MSQSASDPPPPPPPPPSPKTPPPPASSPSLLPSQPLLVLAVSPLLSLPLFALSLWELLPLGRSQCGPIEEASIAISRVLRGFAVKWALVGGAAIVASGSECTTRDVDIVSIPGGIRTIRDALAVDPRFDVDPRTRHTYFNSTRGERVEVEILAPPGTFASCFDADTVVLEQPYGVRVLNPIALLESKCKSVLGRSSEIKKRSDAHDILFLLDYLYQHGIRTSPAEVRVDESFKNWLDHSSGEDSTGRWERIGL